MRREIFFFFFSFILGRTQTQTHINIINDPSFPSPNLAFISSTHQCPLKSCTICDYAPKCFLPPNPLNFSPYKAFLHLLPFRLPLWDSSFISSTPNTCFFFGVVTPPNLFPFHTKKYLILNTLLNSTHYTHL